MRKILPAVFLLFLSLSGCLYVAPIEEEDNAYPYINANAVTPSPGVVELELNNDSAMNITLSAYGDDNADQTLYHRIVMDLRPAGEYRIIATEPRMVQSNNRDRIMYQFRPCSMLSNYNGVIRDGQSIDVYLILSDERFMSDSEIIINKEGEFGQPFKTNPENRAVWVQWSAVFKGECSESDK